MAFKIEASDGANIVRLPPKFRKSGTSDHWLMGKGMIECHDTGGKTELIGLRYDDDFESPAVCGIRTYEDQNFINWEFIPKGANRTFTVGIWQLVITSL